MMHVVPTERGDGVAFDTFGRGKMNDVNYGTNLFSPVKQEVEINLVPKNHTTTPSSTQYKRAVTPPPPPLAATNIHLVNNNNNLFVDPAVAKAAALKHADFCLDYMNTLREAMAAKGHHVTDEQLFQCSSDMWMLGVKEQQASQRQIFGMAVEHAEREADRSQKETHHQGQLEQGRADKDWFLKITKHHSLCHVATSEALSWSWYVIGCVRAAFAVQQEGWSVIPTAASNAVGKLAFWPSGGSSSQSYVMNQLAYFIPFDFLFGTILLFVALAAMLWFRQLRQLLRPWVVAPIALAMAANAVCEHFKALQLGVVVLFLALMAYGWLFWVTTNFKNVLKSKAGGIPSSVEVTTCLDWYETYQWCSKLVPFFVFTIDIIKMFIL